ncbi:hypothetical protein STEG23_034860 [Scotinomys teguina]
MWYMYTMEYYAAEKNNGIMKFAGKWMELENAILSEISFNNRKDLLFSLLFKVNNLSHFSLKQKPARDENCVLNFDPFPVVKQCELCPECQHTREDYGFFHEVSAQFDKQTTCTGDIRNKENKKT